VLVSILNHCSKKNIKPSSTKILVGVSGGLDSMVLLHVLHKLEFNIVAAHINYQLRGQDSEMDFELVKSVCKKLHVPFYHKIVHLDTTKSIQTEARETRRSFFINVLQEEKCDYIATGHHKEDQIETILLSIFKGYLTQSMLLVNGYFLKPLLYITKAEITQYALDHKLSYRVDSSNVNTLYDRNFLRLDIIPALEDRFPNFHNRLLNKTIRDQREKSIYDAALFQSLKPTISEGSDWISIDKSGVKEISHGLDLLKMWLQSEYSFSQDQVDKMLVEGNPNGKFINDRFIAIRGDRKLLIGQKYSHDFNNRVIARADCHDIMQKQGFSFIVIEINSSIHVHRESGVENRKRDNIMVDADKLDWPLSICMISEDDKFQPLGMGGKTKSIMKLLREKGLNYFQRRSFLFIKDKSDRSLIPFLTVDERLKSDNTTKNVLIISEGDKKPC